MKADRRRLARVGRSPPSLTVGGVSFPTVVRGRLSRRVSIAALPRRRSMSNHVMALVHGGARWVLFLQMPSLALSTVGSLSHTVASCSSVASSRQQTPPPEVLLVPRLRRLRVIKEVVLAPTGRFASSL